MSHVRAAPARERSAGFSARASRRRLTDFGLTQPHKPLLPTRTPRYLLFESEKAFEKDSSTALAIESLFFALLVSMRYAVYVCAVYGGVR